MKILNTDRNRRKSFQIDDPNDPIETDENRFK